MTFWDFLEAHGTKMLAVGQGSIAALCGIGGLIPESHMKYWLAASAVLTMWRGVYNSDVIATKMLAQSDANNAAANVAKNAAQPKP